MILCSICLSLTSFTKHNTIRVYPQHCKWQNLILLYGWIIFHCVYVYACVCVCVCVVYILYLPYPFIYWSTLKSASISRLLLWTRMHVLFLISIFNSFRLCSQEWNCVWYHMAVLLLVFWGNEFKRALYVFWILIFFTCICYNYFSGTPLFFFFFGLFAFSRSAPAAHGGFQARGRIGAVVTGLHQSPSNTGSELRLQPTPQLKATPDP